jgi:hypothetical protein
MTFTTDATTRCAHRARSHGRSLRYLATLLIVPALFGVMGCAAMANGRYQKIVIDSAPTPGTVEVVWWCGRDCRDSATYATPARVALRRNRSYSVYAKNENGALVERIIYSQHQGYWQALDFLLLPIVANLIDLAAGADYELSPSQITIPLPPPDAGPEYRSLAPQ